MLVRRIKPEDYGSYKLLRKQDLEDYNESAKSKLEISSQKIKGEFEEVFSNKRRSLLVAEENSKIVGFVIGSLISNTYEKVAYLDDIYVVCDYRKKGVGTSLVAGFKKWSEQNYAKILRLAVLPKNKTAINFYKNLGFKIKHYEMQLNL